jgi:hypothetical protein
MQGDEMVCHITITGSFRTSQQRKNKAKVKYLHKTVTLPTNMLNKIHNNLLKSYVLAPVELEIYQQYYGTRGKA